MTSPTVRADFFGFDARREAQVAHRVDDAALHGLQAVARVRQRAVEDDVHRVVEVRLLGEHRERNALDAVEVQLLVFHCAALVASTPMSARLPFVL